MIPRKIVRCWHCDDINAAETEMWVEGFQGATVMAHNYFGRWVIGPGSDHGWSIMDARRMGDKFRRFPPKRDR